MSPLFANCAPSAPSAPSAPFAPFAPSAASAAIAVAAAVAAASEAAAAAARACKAASEAAAAFAGALQKRADSEESESSSSSTDSDIGGPGPGPGPNRRQNPPLGVPVAAAEVMKLVSALNPERSARRRGRGFGCSGGGGDRLRVGFALKHNEGLLRGAGRVAEADLMATLYDLFCMRSPETYQGRRATRGEYAGLTRTTAITIETLLAMVEEDRAASLASLAASDAAASAASAATAQCDPNSLPEWLEATFEVTGDPSDIVTQLDILGLMRDPARGWKFAGRHKVKKIKQFLKSWFASKGVFYGDNEYYRIGDERFHQVHCKGVVLKPAPPVDLLNQGICGACAPSGHRSKERRVRELFDENGLTYSSHNKAVDGGYRPDFVFDAATHFVVVEVDENQHRAYPADVERSRMVSLCRALGRPTFFVRYNPDAYRPGGGSPEEPLAARERTLVSWLNRLMYSSLRPRGAEVLHLFFDGYAPDSVRPRLIA